jgi:hypothetical protein
MNSREMTALAIVGARERLKALKDEEKVLVQFLQKHGWFRVSEPAMKMLKRLPKSGRRPMSAAQRKAVGRRMKKYWAARRRGDV